MLSGRDGLHLEAGQQIVASDPSMKVPLSMTPGEYAITARAGDLPADEWDSGRFGFRVVEP